MSLHRSLLYAGLLTNPSIFSARSWNDSTYITLMGLAGRAESQIEQRVRYAEAIVLYDR